MIPAEKLGLNIEDLRAVERYWRDILPAFGQPCTQRILLVTDGGLNYNPASGFGLSRFVDELMKISPTPTITKAHRGTDPTADTQNFVFNNTITTANFDQIWLFGIETNPVLTNAEFGVLANFMNAGGGLFATGDHQTLGFAMGGELPRVRKMRDWSSIPMFTDRIDTVTNPGPDRITQFDDQSDEFPQRIFPHFYGSGSSWSPHPLLRSPLGPIDVMPDHPHESVCLVGPTLNAPYNLHGLNFVEFPNFNGVPLSPEIIATSMSAGRYLNPPGSAVGKPPTTPRCFGSISVWDGHKVARGRIVCDSTWHHFVNINLDGTGAVPAPGNNRRGLRNAALVFTQDFHQVAEYYRNIADWIIPSNRRWCIIWIDLLIERYRFPLIEEWFPLPPHPCPWDPRVRLGTLVEDALRINRGLGFAEEIVTAALEDARLEDLASLVRPERAETLARSANLRQNLINQDELRRGVLGSIFDALVRDLPASPFDLTKAIERAGHDDEKLHGVITEAAGSAIDAAKEYYAESMRRTNTFMERATATRAVNVAVVTASKTSKKGGSKAKASKQGASKTKRSK
ncbi:MAG TPA: hypothetical protein VIQ24_20990 [Pyrinomonadaceae bacterium]